LSSKKIYSSKISSGGSDPISSFPSKNLIRFLKNIFATDGA